MIQGIVVNHRGRATGTPDRRWFDIRLGPRGFGARKIVTEVSFDGPADLRVVQGDHVVIGGGTLTNQTTARSWSIDVSRSPDSELLLSHSEPKREKHTAPLDSVGEVLLGAGLFGVGGGLVSLIWLSFMTAVFVALTTTCAMYTGMRKTEPHRREAGRVELTIGWTVTTALLLYTGWRAAEVLGGVAAIALTGVCVWLARLGQRDRA